MFVYELIKKGAPDLAFWTEVITQEPEEVRLRLKASRLHWQAIATPNSWRDKSMFVVRVPVPKGPDFDAVSVAGPLVLNAAKGFSAVIKRPTLTKIVTVELSDPWGSGDEPRTLPNTDARRAEESLMLHVAEEERPGKNRIRDLVRLYLRALSKVQGRYGIQGNGEQSLRFVSHYWDLGDAGVAARFEKVASKLSKARPAPSSGPSERSVAHSLDARLATLEERLAGRGLR